MKIQQAILHFRGHRERGLTLIEILVASALLLFILLGLTMMFNQTQKAFRGGMRQADVVESGRAAMALIASDVEQMIDAGDINVTNFYIRTVPNLQKVQKENGQPFRTNKIYDMFLMKRDNGAWTGVGYAVVGDVPGLGSLKRFQTSTLQETFINNEPYESYRYELVNRLSAVDTQFRPVIDGVIHLQVYPVDASGNVIVTNTMSYPIPGGSQPTNLPTAVEIELGILEPQVYEQARGMPAMPVTIRNEFLERQAGKVHLFRQQIPIRTARK